MKRQADKMQKQAEEMQKQAARAAAAASKSNEEAMRANEGAMPSPNPVTMPPGTDIPAAAPTVQTEEDTEGAFKKAAKENEAAKRAYAEAAEKIAEPVKREQEPAFVVWGEGGADEADAETLHSRFSL